MQFTIVTGMSGSGKTRVIRNLEDMGYFCVDNMPPVLIPKLSEMLSSMNGKFNNVAIVVDIRVGDMINELIEQVNILRHNYAVKMIFLDADNETIVRRYKETRRSHPIDNPNGLLAAIEQERITLSGLMTEADYVIDTSNFTNAELLGELKEICQEDKSASIEINVMAFGFKYGIPLDADLVFDVRCFPNPFYIDELKHKTGNDREVQDYVMSFSQAVEFMDKLNDMMDFMIPLYIEEGKISLTVAIGCTGGKHRSVTMANKLAEHLKEEGYEVNTSCRDMGRE
ncbi:MAG: RNase adapter RapZ [Clostridiales bacterium]|nr:RNase adapter RapZ [Clostridiales bacterium]